MAELIYALSIRQPWAALIVHGIKTIEVRSWKTRLRGRLLIHASKILDDRPTGWDRLPAFAEATAALRGGIVGEVYLVGCREYHNADDFARDAERHLNPKEWFRPPGLYGFEFARPRTLPFLPCSGNARFFRVAWNED